MNTAQGENEVCKNEVCKNEVCKNEVCKNEVCENEVCENERYESEGFLCINKASRETFVKGEIRDINLNLICPGVLVPIINPIKETSRDAVGDEHLVSIESCLPHITHYYPLQKGKKIRIYWSDFNNMFMVSTEHRIYIYDDDNYYLDSVNFDLLDKQFCYFAIVCSREKKLILTNIVHKEKPELGASYNISEDLAFAYHIETEFVKCDVDALAAKKIIDEQLDTFQNGVLFILDDGRQIEYRNKNYNYYCMLEKPETMSIYIYFVLCLNKHAEGDSFADYYTSLFEDIADYLAYFPEYNQPFQYMSEKLNNYIMFECGQDNASDQDKIKAVNKLLKLETEELLIALIAF